MNKLNYKKKLRSILLLVITLILPACNVSNLDQVKENNALVSEYNEVIKDYNKLAAEFTELARFVDKNFEGSDVSIEIWNNYDKKKSNVISGTNKLNNFKFEYKENELCMEEIDPLINNIEDYLNEIEKFRNNSFRKYPEFKGRLDNLYNSILNRSNAVSAAFENIYKQNFEH